MQLPGTTRPPMFASIATAPSATGQNSRIQRITMSLGYIYRIVSCRTCDSPIDVEYLGTTLNVRIAGTVSNPGQLRCSECGESHKYSGQDLKFWIKDHPPGRTR